MTRRELLFLLFLSPISLFAILNFLFPLPADPYKAGGRAPAKVVLSYDGIPLRYFADSLGEWQYRIKLEEVSKKYLEALLTYEDRYFYHHLGVNPISLVRSVFLLAKYRRAVSGGSTLTMQTARLITPVSRTWYGKLHQIFRALQLEYRYSKNEILELYINLAPMGGNIRGVGAASYFYFDRAIAEVNYAEAALLAVLPQAPSRLRPDRYKERAEKARNKLAARLCEKGVWKWETCESMGHESIFLLLNPRPKSAALLSERLIKKHPEDAVIRTFINKELQENVENLLRNTGATLPQGLTAAILVARNSDMAVIAYAGSMEYGNLLTAGYVDMLTKVRSPGSSLKPFIYALALDLSLIHSESLLIDAPRAFSDYQAANFYRGFSGPVAASDALRRSLNVPAVELLEHVTPRYFHSILLNAGVNYLSMGGRPNLSIALGGGGIKLTDIPILYAALANEGEARPLRYTPSDILEEGRPLMTREAAYIIYEILRKQFRDDHIFSRELTGRENRLAWKTGTSYGFRDAIAAGVTPKYAMLVWVGRANNAASPGHTGANTALPILFNLSDMLDEMGPEIRSLIRPDNVTETDICWPSGLSVELVSGGDCAVKKRALTIAGATPATLPETPTSAGQSYLLSWHEDKNGKRVSAECAEGEMKAKSAHAYPRLTEPWIPRSRRRQYLLPEWSDKCKRFELNERGELFITGVMNESTLRSARVEGGYPQIPLSAVGNKGKINWFLNGELIDDDNLSYKIKSPGVYELIAIDSALQMDQIQFYVD